MINSKGIIQNNRTASDFIRNQKKFNNVYKLLTKEEERKMVEGYAKLKLTDGKPTWNDKFECDFEWTGNRDELIEKLVMHNLQCVTKISTKHCQDTRDYDNMYAKGLFGLVRAANMFHPFKLIVKNGKPQYDEQGNPTFVKFNTFAQFWVFKYVMDEFGDKSIHIDNNSVSLDELIRIHNDQSRNMTLENYLSNIISPDVEQEKTVKTVVDEISSVEATDIYDRIHEYIETSGEISAMEKSVLENSFYGGESNVKKLSSMLKIPQSEISDLQTSALGKLKDFLYEEFGIESISDII